MDEETIVALATPPGRGGIAVIRLSGSQSETIARRLVQPFPARPRPRRSYHGFVQDEAGRRIDECLAIVFRAPRSYSGEDMAEISLHSNLFVVEEVIALACRGGARPALPGEFTYRAFRNGKLDLIQAEAVNDLIRANSRAYSRMEFDNLEGRLSRSLAEVRRALLQAAAAIEARIEFAEDQHLAPAGDGGALAAAGAALDAILASGRFGEALNHGLQVVIAGRVNVGKSSLFNALLMRERSIISAIPGTTRDYIQETLHLEGFAFRITDMAGIRAGSDDEVEKLGMERSLDRLAQADAVIFMVDASRPLEEADFAIHRLLAGRPRLLLANKCDLARDDVVRGIRAAFPDEALQRVSAKTGENLEAVNDFLRGLLRRMPEASAAAAVNRRQRGLLEKLREAVGRAVRLQADEPEPLELEAEEVRLGLRLIGELTGAVGADDVLERVFATFCIGK